MLLFYLLLVTIITFDAVSRFVLAQYSDSSAHCLIKANGKPKKQKDNS